VIYSLGDEEPTTLRIGRLLRPHWPSLALALVAVVGETAADVLQPWPIKIVVDNVVQSKRLPPWLDAIVTGLFAGDKYATLNFAVAAIAVIAMIGAVSGYGREVPDDARSRSGFGHDLRRTVYQHIQRLSSPNITRPRSGDLMMRMTSDIGAIQDFINTALIGILVNVLTLAGILGVMFSINWRFTLLALSVVPVLFVVVYFYTRRIKAASRAVRKREGELLSGVAECPDLHPRRAGVRSRRLRGSAVRVGEPAATSKRASRRAARKPSCRRSSK